MDPDNNIAMQHDADNSDINNEGLGPGALGLGDHGQMDANMNQMENDDLNLNDDSGASVDGLGQGPNSQQNQIQNQNNQTQNNNVVGSLTAANLSLINNNSNTGTIGSGPGPMGPPTGLDFRNSSAGGNFPLNVAGNNNGSGNINNLNLINNNLGGPGILGGGSGPGNMNLSNNREANFFQTVVNAAAANNSTTVSSNVSREELYNILAQVNNSPGSRPGPGSDNNNPNTVLSGTSAPPVPGNSNANSFNPSNSTTMSNNANWQPPKLMQNFDTSNGVSASQIQNQIQTTGQISSTSLQRYFKSELPDPIPSIQIATNTWARESHGLYDYESRTSLAKTFLNVQQPVTLTRKGSDIQAQVNLPNLPNVDSVNNELLARVVIRNNKFCVDAARVDNRIRSGKLWRVVKDLQNGYSLSEGDSIKLGRFKMKVRQICCLPVGFNGSTPDSANELASVASVGPLSAPAKPCNTSEEELKRMENISCRICLLEGSGVEDPLIKPCECKGTIEYVHLGCLRHWVRGKLDLPEQQHGSYFYKPMSCELCKTQYATHMQDTKPDGEAFPLIELPKTTPPYIVLERDSNRPDIKGVHVISLAEKKLLKLGRGHESDVRFADVSISRWHATVHYDNALRGFILTDHGSKFGTLVATKTPLPLEINGVVSLQVGRSVVEFKLNSTRNNGESTPSSVPPSSSSSGTSSQQTHTHFGSGLTVADPSLIANNNLNPDSANNLNKFIGPNTKLSPGTVLGMNTHGHYYIVSDSGEVVLIQTNNSCPYDPTTGKLQGLAMIPAGSTLNNGPNGGNSNTNNSINGSGAGAQNPNPNNPNPNPNNPNEVQNQGQQGPNQNQNNINNNQPVNNMGVNANINGGQMGANAMQNNMNQNYNMQNNEGILAAVAQGLGQQDPNNQGGPNNRFSLANSIASRGSVNTIGQRLQQGWAGLVRQGSNDVMPDINMNNNIDPNNPNSNNNLNSNMQHMGSVSSTGSNYMGHPMDINGMNGPGSGGPSSGNNFNQNQMNQMQNQNYPGQQQQQGQQHHQHSGIQHMNTQASFGAMNSNTSSDNGNNNINGNNNYNNANTPNSISNANAASGVRRFFNPANLFNMGGSGTPSGGGPNGGPPGSMGGPGM